MNSLFFWKSWSKSYKLIFWSLAALALASIFTLWFAYFQNPSLAFTWENLQQIETVETFTHSFSVGLFEFAVPADSLLLFETLSGSVLHPVEWSFYFFLFCLTIGTVLFITIITTLKRFSFLVGMGLFILLIISLRLEVLELFGLSNKIPTIITLVLVGGLAYYFQSFRTETTFAIRLLTFLSLVILLSVLFLFSSKVQQPFMHVAVNGLVAGMVLCIVFIGLVAHEIVALFITIVTKSTKPSKSALHFFVISGIYFANLVLSYLIKEGQLALDLWVINSFFLITVSAVLAVWGFRQREPLYENLLSSNSLAVYACLSLMAIAFSIMGFFVVTGSGTMVDGFQDLILYSHLGYGLIFIVYVISNFSPMLLGNLPVYKILYKPGTMPFFTFRMGSLIATFAFLSYASSWSAYLNQGYAAFYNAYGDLYYMQGNLTVAEGYFKKSVVYRNQNQHAHYALATIYAAQLDPAKERIEYSEICSTSPSEIAFINLSESYGASGNNLAASVVLIEGLKKIPASAILQNALALTFSKFNQQDSAMYFFQQARSSSQIKDIAETNLLAVGAKFKINFPADSLLMLLDSEKEGARSNALALANTQQLALNIKYTLPKDTTLTVRQSVLLINHLINQKSKTDTALLSQIVSLARRPSNDSFKEALMVSVSQAYYEHGMTKKASELVREVAYGSGKGKYFNLLGLWLMEQNNPTTAAGYFRIAKEKEIKTAPLYEAIAWLEADSLARALPLLESLLQTKDSLRIKTILKILKSKSDQVLGKSEKYQFCRYKIPLTDSSQFQRAINSIQNDDLRAVAILDRSKKWFSLDEPEMAISLLQKIKSLTLKDKKLYNNILHFNLMIIAGQENWTLLKQQLTSPLSFEGRPNEKIYLQALLDEVDGRETEAKQKFNYLANASAQSEEMLLASAHFFLKDSTDRLKPYSILVNGLLAKPNSIKLLKAYVKEAAILGFDDESQQSLDKLQKLMRPEAFKKYVKENPDYFEVEK